MMETKTYCRHGNYDPRGQGWCHSGYCPSGEHVLYGSLRTQTEAQAYLQAHPELRRGHLADSAKGFLLIGATYVMVLMLALIVVFGILMNIGTSQFGQALLGFVIPALVLWSLMGLGLMRIAHRKAR